MESHQPIERLKDKKKIKLYLIHINICKMIPFQYEFLLVGAVFMHSKSAGIGMLYLFASSHMLCI